MRKQAWHEDLDSDYGMLWFLGAALAALFAAIVYSAYAHTGEVKVFRAECDAMNGQSFKAREEYLCLADGRIVKRLHT